MESNFAARHKRKCTFVTWLQLGRREINLSSNNLSGFVDEDLFCALRTLRYVWVHSLPLFSVLEALPLFSVLEALTLFEFIYFLCLVYSKLRCAPKSTSFV